MNKISEFSNDEIASALHAGIVTVWAEPRDFPADHRLWIERLGDERANFDAASNPARKSELLFSRSAIPHLARQWSRINGLGQVMFNIAHTRDRFVAAFSIQGAVGVDLERVDREVKLSALERVAAPAEQAWLAEQSDPWERLKLWCLKEAAVKSHRGGMWLDGPSWEPVLPVSIGRWQSIQRYGSEYPARVELIDSEWLLALVLAGPSAASGVHRLVRWAE